MLDRLAEDAVDLFGDHLGAGDLEFVAFAAHRLDQDREVQLATTGDGKDVGLLGPGDAQREVRLQLAEQALAQLTGGRKLALATGEG